jgi:two-component system sensor histidine kinase KdpD
MLRGVGVLDLIEPRPRLRYVAALAGPGAATLIALGLGSERTTAAGLVYLLGVVASATVGGLGAGIVASILSFVGLNYFFTPPLHTLSVGKSDDLIALVVFASVGMIVSTLVAIGLAQRARAERRELEARSLYAISSRLVGTGDLDLALTELASSMVRLFGLARCEVRIAAKDGTPVTHASAGSEVDDAAGQSQSVALATADRELGALVLWPGHGAFGETERRVASIFARQTASALERGLLEAEAREARLSVEADRVRRGLLSAVSHDFRTPLASIKAALTTLTTGAESSLTDGDRKELLGTALEETERLERLVTNLLDLTRIRSGALAPELIPMPVDDVVEDALAGVRSPLAARRVSVFIRPDLPLLNVDPVQVGQVLQNVLQNAAKFSPPRSEIRIAASRWQGAVEIRVSDQGPGIPPADREAVFEEFYRAGDGRIAGTGLGLAVAKAIVLAHGGKIWVEDTPGGGATVVVRLPAIAPRT